MERKHGTIDFEKNLSVETKYDEKSKSPGTVDVGGNQLPSVTGIGRATFLGSFDAKSCFIQCTVEDLSNNSNQVNEAGLYRRPKSMSLSWSRSKPNVIHQITMNKYTTNNQETVNSFPFQPHIIENGQIPNVGDFAQH